ncbi:CGNR zinc finger domain-containing protein [Streptomyces sp. NPDC005708]|uniref:CGNR zinc finger domain-containing protein n=1 Tax=Streptomyces sp. NPDC005708 TaxID=3154564 RepID=UPI00340381EB
MTPAPGEERSTALALANSRLPRGSNWVDFLATPEAAHRWLVGHDLPTEPSEAIRDYDLEHLANLRAAARDVLEAFADGRAPDASSVETVNSAAAREAITPRLSWSQQGPERSWQAGLPGVQGALAALARDVIDLVCSAQADSVRRCEAHGCVRLFVREHARRRWCSTTCGDRVRAVRHQRRVEEQRHATAADA